MTSPSAGRGQTREERPTLDDDIARARRNWKVFGDVQSASALRLADAVADLRSRLAAAEADAAREFESGNDWCQRALAAEAELDALRDGIPGTSRRVGRYCCCDSSWATESGWTTRLAA